MESAERILDPRLFEVYYFEGHPDHNAAWDAIEAPDGRAYIGLCNEGEPGLSAALYVFDPSEKKREHRLRHLFDVDKVTHDNTRHGHIPQSKFHTSMSVGGDGRLYSTTHTTAPGWGRPFWTLSQDYYDLDYRYPGSHFLVYDPATGRVEDWGIPVQGDSIYAGCLDWDNRKYYMLTLTRGHLHVLDLDTGLTDDLGRFTRGWQCALFRDRQSRVWTADMNGEFTYYDPATGRVERPGISMPRPPGRDNLWSFILPPAHWKDEKWVGTMQYEARLWLLDIAAPGGPAVEDLGMGWDAFRPDLKVQRNQIWEPQFGRDGKLYYGVSAYRDSIYADSENIMRAGVRVIQFDMQTRERRNLGMVWADGRPAFVFSSRFILPDGRIGWADSCFIGKPARLIVFDPRRLAEVETPSSEARATMLSVTPGELRERQQTARRNRHAVDVCDLDRHSARVIRVFGEGFERDSCAVTALAAQSGIVWGGTSGEHAGLFAVDAATGETRVTRLCEAPDAAGITALFACASGVVGTARGAGGGGYVFAAGSSGSIEQLAALPNAQQPIACAMTGEALVVLTDAGNLLRCDLSSPDMEPLARVVPAGLSPVLIASESKTFGCLQNGEVFVFDTRSGEVAATGQYIPAPRGRQYDAVWQSGVAIGDRIVGGTSDGYLFELDTVSRGVRNLGKPLLGPGLPALAVRGDGAVFGAGGRPGGIAHIFSYVPERGFEDLGILSNENSMWQAFCIGSMAASEDGTIYIGEDDAIGHLWACSFN